MEPVPRGHECQLHCLASRQLSARIAAKLARQPRSCSLPCGATLLRRKLDQMRKDTFRFPHFSEIFIRINGQIQGNATQKAVLESKLPYSTNFLFLFEFVGKTNY